MSARTTHVRTELPVSIFLEAIVAVVNLDTLETTVKQVCILIPFYPEVKIKHRSTECLTSTLEGQVSLCGFLTPRFEVTVFLSP